MDSDVHFSPTGGSMSTSISPPTWRTELEELIRAEVRERVIAKSRKQDFAAVLSRRASDHIDAETRKIFEASRNLALPTFLTKLDSVSLLTPLCTRWASLSSTEQRTIALDFIAYYFSHQGLYAKT